LKKQKHENIDSTDIRILRLLQEDARISLREIARRLRLSPSTIHERMRKLRKEGILKGFAPLIDYSKLGYKIAALILVNVEGGRIREFERRIKLHKCVTGVYDITGEYDVALFVKCKDIDDLNKLVKSLIALPYVKRSVTSIVLELVAEKYVLTI